MSLVHRLKETDKKIMLAVLLAVTWYKKKKAEFDNIFLH